MEQAIVDYYLQQEHSQKRKKITLRSLFPEWFAYKWQDTNNSCYLNRISYDWKRYYDNDEIADRPVVEFTILALRRPKRRKRKVSGFLPETFRFI